MAERQSAEPPFKRIRLTSEDQLTKHYTVFSSDVTAHPPSATPAPQPESCFVFEPLDPAHFRAGGEPLVAGYALDITNYIPAGCLRVYLNDVEGISIDSWELQNDRWSVIALPVDNWNRRDGPFLQNNIQGMLLRSEAFAKHFNVLLNSGMVRMEFKTNDNRRGQARVYILRDDVARANQVALQRSITDKLKVLLHTIDLSHRTWDGCWTESTPYLHIDASQDEHGDSYVPETLLNVFNTLSSPFPMSHIVKDSHCQESMGRLLDNDVHGLRTKMFTYQCRSSALMLQRETQPGQIIDPRLRVLVDQRGGRWYCDPDAPFYSLVPRMYEAPRGGILAENMGLGKTLICLALILATRDLSSHIPPEHSVGLLPIRKTTGSLVQMTAAMIGRTSIPWKTDFALAELDGLEFKNATAALHNEAGHYFLPPPPSARSTRNAPDLAPRKLWLSTTTIVVVPANLLQQWCGEIQKHTIGLKVLVMKNGKQILPPARELLGFDIILFTKARFEKEAKLCFDDSTNPENSSLRDVHFKRLIVDEGHTLGNSSNSSPTEMFSLINKLEVSARWVVSGTPTSGLYGLETENSKVPSLESATDTHSDSERNQLVYRQERKDLVKLGNIAMYYLKARPWASSPDGDVAVWSKNVMQPRHGQNSKGTVDSMRTALEGLVIRHRPTDVAFDVELPPLIQNYVYLDGCLQNKLMLNAFNIMIIVNAVTSERKDADYFFHPKQRKHLQALVSNMRQGSFFWSGLKVHDIENTTENVERFLAKGAVHVTPHDSLLLKQVLEFGKLITSNEIWKSISKWEEMPMFVEHGLDEEITQAVSLDNKTSVPTLMGATMIHDTQKFVESQSRKENPTEGLIAFAIQSRANARRAQMSSASVTAQRTSRRTKDNGPPLAGGVTVGNDGHPRVKASISGVAQTIASTSSPPLESTDQTNGISDSHTNADTGTSLPRHSILSPSQTLTPAALISRRDSYLKESYPATAASESVGDFTQSGRILPLKSALKRTQRTEDFITLESSSPSKSASIVSTASTKLTYLMDRIALHQEEEKILVFYESDTVAFYIAQALECLNIKHLIYAKSLTPENRSQYVAAFQSNDLFRVLLMDVSQAAFGLDVSSASRVYFINPVFSPTVEAQAIKRAHRIGQKKPVYVETLVLNDSIEEVLVKRRQDLKNEDHQNYKSILDDQTIYDWIKNVKMLDIPIDVPDIDQMAKLETPKQIFGIGAGSKADKDRIDSILAGEPSTNPAIGADR